MTEVRDPLDAGRDPAMPRVAPALDPQVALPALKAVLQLPELRLRGIEVLRHKPGRRCLIGYHLQTGGGEGLERLVVLGKVRAKGLDGRSFTTQKLLFQRTPQASGNHDLRVAEPLGVIPELDMWLQRRIPGRTLTTLLGHPDAGRFVVAAARALRKLHQTGVPAQRRHTLSDELSNLVRRLEQVAAARPAWAARLARLAAACCRRAEVMDRAPTASVHRDFYPDQVLVAGDGVYLLDFDLYAEGDPALDVGNFLAHLRELAIRRGDAAALAAEEQAFLRTYLGSREPGLHARIETYLTLSLARHVYISTTFADRRPFTEALIACCEARLGLSLQAPESAGTRLPDGG